MKKYPVKSIGYGRGMWVGLPGGFVGSGAAAVPSQPPPKMGGVMWGYWKPYFLLLGKELRNSSVTVKHQ